MKAEESSLHLKDSQQIENLQIPKTPERTVEEAQAQAQAQAQFSEAQHKNEIEKTNPPLQTFSITEITDQMTEKLNEILMEVNHSDSEISKVYDRLEKRLDTVAKTFK
ncbi:hypothetical protein FOA43_004419 [Brettanomyces nanus]|uniref:Uncharacterized protein n=1 Tax=Eeniella nana TaxID=13502 RepID=A0A875SBA3_EENNA|nr:uncharacterized protein FOA43_004419 [Brettanomyces nanus]QPG77022.1 hypothetical protein FOA43_004419 [Brettanomyces nanus]